jgi:aspartate ammonia-lyase
MNNSSSRQESDFLGTRGIPADAYWGVHTARAVENFPISGQPLWCMPELVRSLAFVKKAAAQANASLGALDAERAGFIAEACDELIAGRMHEQFVVDVIQGGAGTSTNMNANEVIANRALELMGHARGRYEALHPNDHVNASQSTNDVYPTALRLSAWIGIGELLREMAALRQAFEAKAVEFADVLKIGRTQLQDAVPMTLGQEFTAYAVMIGEDEARLNEARALLTEVNLGATAVGPGKVNPVIPEVMNQVAFEVIGNDVTITMAAEAGQLQLNAFVPIMGWSLHKSVRHLRQACLTLRVNCVDGIRANRELLAHRVAESVTLVTALNPLIGYEKAALVAKTALARRATIADTAQALGVMSADEVNALLVPEKLTRPMRLEG